MKAFSWEKTFFQLQISLLSAKSAQFKETQFLYLLRNFTNSVSFDGKSLHIWWWKILTVRAGERRTHSHRNLSIGKNVKKLSL